MINCDVPIKSWRVTHGRKMIRAVHSNLGDIRKSLCRMQAFVQVATNSAITDFGICRTAHWNLGTAQLVEQAIERHEGELSSDGALVVRTGQFTGRSPKDKYIVREPGTESTVNWGSVNQPMTEAQFDGLFERMLQFWEGQDVFVQDCFGGRGTAYQTADPRDCAARLACSVRASVVCPGRPATAKEHVARIRSVFRARFPPIRPRTARGRRPRS